jgi:hypothetical protein
MARRRANEEPGPSEPPPGGKTQKAEASPTTTRVWGVGGEASAGWTRKRRGTDHHRRGAAGTDGRIDANGATDAHGATGGEDGTDDRRHGGGRAVTGAGEGHDGGERERVCAGRNHVLPAWGRIGPAGRGCQGAGYGRYGGPLTPE